MTVDRPGQQVLERSSVLMLPSGVDGEHNFELRFCVSLPAQGTTTVASPYGRVAHDRIGRTILGDPALRIFSSTIPLLAENMLYSSQSPQDIAGFVGAVEDQDILRQQVVESGSYSCRPLHIWEH